MATLYILVGSIIAVSAIVAFNVWIGGWTPSRIESADEAARILRQDLLTFEPGDVRTLSSDGLSALVKSRDGPSIGYLSARGAGHVSRLIEPGHVASTRIEDGSAIVVRFRDFTFPAARITLGDEELAREWAARLNGDPV
ncbi:MAG: hypothetical protein CMF74_03665 [Maricaulis sp.]|nr:hypothetical protein [Maricaulis sp.]HAQ35072.1 hypothetical protein [Alphaproteobacteria bacterium]